MNTQAPKKPFGEQPNPSPSSEDPFDRITNPPSGGGSTSSPGSLTDYLSSLQEIDDLKSRISKVLYGASGMDSDSLSERLPRLDVKAVSERAKKFDCRHPFAHRCWRLLHRALTNDYQGMHETDSAKLAKGFEKWDQFRTHFFASSWLHAQKTAEAAIQEWIAQPDGDDQDLSGVDPIEQQRQAARTPGWTYAMEAEIQDEMAARGMISVPTDDAELRPFVLGVMKRTEIAAKKQGLDLRGAFSIAGFQGDSPMDQQRKATMELVTIIDMALGANDFDTFRAAMDALVDLNPSAHAAIKCLAGVRGTMADMSVSWTPSSPDALQPTVPQMLQGAQPDEDVTGYLTGTVYFSKRPDYEHANPLQLVGRSIQLVTLCGFFPRDCEAIGDKIKDAGRDAWAGHEKRRVDRLIHYRERFAERQLERAERGNVSDPVQFYRDQLETLREIREQARKGEMTVDEANTAIIGLDNELGRFHSSQENQGQEGPPPYRPDTEENSSLPLFPDLNRLENWPTPGTGGDSGELPHPDSQPLPDDNSFDGQLRKLRDLQMQIREPLELQDHPEYQWLAQAMILNMLEQRENELINKMLQYEESEEAWTKRRMEKTMPLPIDSMLHPELPGEAEALQNCFVADPVQEENPI